MQKKSDHSAQANLAADAIRLAKLDAMCRAGQLNPSFEGADPADVEDLLALLAIVPFDALIHPRIRTGGQNPHKPEAPARGSRPLACASGL